MKEKLLRVGTTYIPVADVEEAKNWYVNNLDAELSYQDEDKAIINLADQSFFLVKTQENETANFIDQKGKAHFSLTFEVDGWNALEALHKELRDKGVRVGEIEDRGHPGNNFVFWDLDKNLFDVWSELSPSFKKRKQ
ncbi:VOC family protein [Halobacillus sp. MO56]